MMPINDPVLMLVNAMRTGGNPMALLGQMAGQDPRVAQAMQMINGKSPAQLQQIAENMARERGTSVNAIIQELGLMPR